MNAARRTPGARKGGNRYARVFSANTNVASSWRAGRTRPPAVSGTCIQNFLLAEKEKENPSP